MSVTQPPPGPISYLFVDGANLKRTVEDVARRYQLGSPEMFWSALRAGHRKAYYYDAVPVQQHDEDDVTYIARVGPKRRELDLIEREDGFHVRSGHAYRSKRRGQEQKMVDVQLAVDALSMASRGLFSAATIITSDLDFRPLIVALVDMGVDVTLRYSPGQTNTDLMAAADQAYPLQYDQIIQWLAVPGPRVVTGTLDSISVERLQEVPIAQWSDEKFGFCQIAPDRLSWVLQTGSAPKNPQHRLVVHGRSVELIRKWAKDHQDLDVPEF